MDLKWEKKFDELNHTKEERRDVLEQANDELVSWKLSVDAAMDSIKLELKRLTKEWDRSVLESVVVDLGLLAKLESVSARPSIGIHTDGPMGHRDDLHYRDQGFRSPTTFFPGSVKGTLDSTPPIPPKFHGPLFESSMAPGRSVDQGPRYLGKLPKISFSTFDGYNPRLWISRCEIYFDMFHVEPDSWIRVASMHLSPVIAC